MNELMDPPPPQSELRRRPQRRAIPDNVANDNVTPQEEIARAVHQREGVNRRDPPVANPTAGRRTTSKWKTSQLYFLLSAVLALLAIIVAPFPEPVLEETPPQPNMAKGSALESIISAAAVGLAAKQEEKDPETRRWLLTMQERWNIQRTTSKKDVEEAKKPKDKQKKRKRTFGWLHIGRSMPQKEDTKPLDGWQWIDPAIRKISGTTPMDVIDKILTSTPRLLAIANFIVSLTYLVHAAVATFFLGQDPPFTITRPNGRSTTQTSTSSADVMDWSSPARERMGGFLLFKLLLVSTAVSADTLDLLILFSWFTLVSFFRSLDDLAHATTKYLSAVGQPPRPGVLHLLTLVLIGDVLAAATCVALFHAAGWSMVALLTCDCALLAGEVLSHILKHFMAVLDDTHTTAIQEIETRQIAMHRTVDAAASVPREIEEISDDELDGFELVEAEKSNETKVKGADEGGESALPAMTLQQLQNESRRLDQQMELLDLEHARRLAVLETSIFGLELVCHALAIGHYCHVWSLVGVNYNLIDGVLTLHIHSAISSACKKVARRRTVHCIARNLQERFPDATEEDLREASTTGDVCCICLGTMSTGGHVKKVGCGHLYHTHCLREVVERAQTIEEAKCPLCRASVLDGQRPDEPSKSEPRNAPAPEQVPPGAQPPAAVGRPQAPVEDGNAGQFRFVTEGAFPAWLPLTAFSFELGGQRTELMPQRAWPPQPQPVAATPPVAENANQEDTGDRAAVVPNPEPAVPQPAPEQPSLFRRLLQLAGGMPMTPEEEQRALANLVDMFPQYDRNDLLRELRHRGSPELVVEAILRGVFSGLPRGDT